MADIIIPFYNKSHLVVRCLGSVLHNSVIENHVVLIDDGSDSAELDEVMQYIGDKPNITLISHDVNKGYKEAIHTGLKALKSPYVILLNNDTVVSEGFDQKLVEPIKMNPSLAATAPVSNHPTDLYQYREYLFGATASEVDDKQSFVSSKKLDNIFTDAPYLTGMCMALDYSLFNSSTLFDSDYRHGYFEDLALCCKIRNLGFSLSVREDCFVYHDGHSTYKDKSQSEKHKIVMHNFGIFESQWGHLPDHQELLVKMDYAGKKCPL